MEKNSESLPNLTTQKHEIAADYYKCLCPAVSRYMMENCAQLQSTSMQPSSKISRCTWCHTLFGDNNHTIRFKPHRKKMNERKVKSRSGKKVKTNGAMVIRCMVCFKKTEVDIPLRNRNNKKKQSVTDLKSDTKSRNISKSSLSENNTKVQNIQPGVIKQTLSKPSECEPLSKKAKIDKKNKLQSLLSKSRTKKKADRESRFLSISTIRRCESQQESSANESTSEEEDHEAAVKDFILHAALSHVPTLGWTRKAIVEGTKSAGYPPTMHGLFPKEGADLVFYFYRTANAELAKHLEEENQLVEQGTLQKKKISIFVRDSIEARLRMLAPYVDTWPQAMSLMAMPQNVPEALQNLYTLTDDIWYHAGDRSTDFNFYTKRGLLAAIYKATELHMVQDKSEDFTDTWDFLDRRIDTMGTFGKCVRQVSEGKDKLGDVLWGSFLVGRNLLGINDRQR